MSLSFLPNLPRETEPIDFEEAFSFPPNLTNAQQLLQATTRARQACNEKLTNFQSERGSVESALNSYLGLIVGFTSDGANYLSSKPQSQISNKPIPLSRGACAIWSDFSRQKKSKSFGSLDFEVHNVLLNYGLWLMTNAIGQTTLQLSSNPSSLLSSHPTHKALASQFSQAAGVFTFLQAVAPQKRHSFTEPTNKQLSPSYSPDLHLGTLEALELISLAEGESMELAAWEILNRKSKSLSVISLQEREKELEKENEDGKQTLSNASLCQDLGLKYQLAKEKLDKSGVLEGGGCLALNKKWVMALEYKAKLYSAKALLYMGIYWMSKDTPEAGKGVKTLTEAFNSIKECPKLLSKFLKAKPQTQQGDAIQQELSRWQDLFEDNLKKAIRENNMIYNERVPDNLENIKIPESTRKLGVEQPSIPYCSKLGSNATPEGMTLSLSSQINGWSASEFKLDEKWTMEIWMGLIAKEDAVQKQKSKKQSKWLCF